MGVSNLWTLLEPCGCRVHIQALRGRRVAVGANKFVVHYLKKLKNNPIRGSVTFVGCTYIHVCRCLGLDL